MRSNSTLKFIMVNLTVTIKLRVSADVFGKRIILVTAKSTKVSTRMESFVDMEDIFGQVVITT